MAILESVRELASKLGADTNGRTIADQINIINQHLEADTANDIAGAVKEYSKKAGSGGGGGETFEVNGTANEDDMTATVDKTLAEALEAFQAGKNVIFKIVVEGRTYTTFAATPIYNSTMTGYDSLFGSYAMYIHPQTDKLASLGYYYTGETTMTYVGLNAN
jgi:hypothetical protein